MPTFLVASMKIHCPHCDQRLAADQSLYGQEVDCPNCGEPFQVPGPEFRYWAFISYSHQDNLAIRQDGSRDRVRWAEWLHHSLESYRIPEAFADRTTVDGEAMPKRFFPVFQDEKELPINSDLGGSIREALEQSRFLIVICSPRSAVSRYVNEEVRYFKQLGRGDQIFAVIIDGEPNASLGLKAGVRPERECFCPALRHPLDENGVEDLSALLEQEPIAGDVRDKAHEPPHEVAAKELRRGHGEVLEFAKLKLIAGMMGVGLDDLVQRDRIRQVQERRRRRNRWLAVASIILALLAVSGWFGHQAWEQQKLAEKRQIEADEALKRSEEERLEKERVTRESAKSDREIGLQLAADGQVSDALAYLARAMETYPSEAMIAAEMAVAALNEWGPYQPSRIWTGHDESVYSVDFHPDGRRLVSAGGSKALFWDVEKNDPVGRMESKEQIREAKYSRDGGEVAVSTAFGVVLRETESGREIATLPGTGGATVNFDREGTRLLTATPFHEAQVWNAKSGAALTGALGDFLVKAQISPNGKWVGTTNSHGHITLYQLENGASSKSGGESGPGGGVANWIEFSPDSRHYIVFVTGSVFLAETTTGRAIHEFPESEQSYISPRFSPDGLWVVTGSNDNRARIWSLIDYRLIATLDGHQEPITYLDISRDGRRILTAANDDTVRVWDAADGKLLQVLGGHTADVLMARFSPDGLRIASASDDRSVILWSLAPVPERLFVESTKGLPEFGSGISWAPDGRRIGGISPDRRSVSVWSLNEGRLEASLQAREQEPIGSIVLGKDPALLATLPENSIMPGQAPKLWNLASGDVLATLDPGDVAAFSPDGTRLFSGSSLPAPGTLWDAKRVTRLMEFTELSGGFGRSGPALPVVFSRDGKFLATREGDVWEIESKRRIVSLRILPGDSVSNLDFSPDGRLIAGSSGDGKATIRLWELPSGKLQGTLNAVERNAALDWGRTMSGQKPDAPAVAQYTEFSSDGKLILAHAYMIGSLVWVWELETRNQVAVLTGHRGNIESASFNPAGDRVVTCGADRTLRLWNALDGRPMAILPIPSGWEGGVRFTLDGSRLIPTGRGSRYWEVFNPRGNLPPPWFPDFMRLLAKKQVTATGQVEFITADRWIEVRKALESESAKGRSAGNPYLHLLRQWLD
ncbi:MAG: TIR domain-containing protein [Verrucomicrobiales bacterium]|nr:TIR domain-containing protein [Verrucomicrobiales bacterium]